MPLRFNPLTALEGSFRGFPFLMGREAAPGGQRGVEHEYPDRDVPYFEPLGRRRRAFDLDVYFIGPTADVQADAFCRLLEEGKPGPLIRRFKREIVYAKTWTPIRDAGTANWVSVSVNFVEAGRNQYPSSQTSWPHTLLAAALAARDAIAEALEDALDLIDLPLEVADFLEDSAEVLVDVLEVAAVLVGGGSPSSALTAAAGLAEGFLADVLPEVGELLDTALLATATAELIAGWADALAGPTPDSASRARAIDSLFVVYDEAASDSWYAAGTLTPIETVEVANQAAYSAAIRRLALIEAARLAASLEFRSYDAAAALRQRFADAFDDEVNAATTADGAREVLASLQSTTLLAISEAGADKARLVPYAVPAPRTAISLAQLFYPEDPDVAGRSAELAARNGVVHPAFVPTEGERLSA